MTFKKRVEATSKKAHRRFAVGLAVLLAVCLMFVGAVGADGVSEQQPVAKVGETLYYYNIDDAVTSENWTSGSTLTLLADVTLSDTITLKSIEYHILDLGKYTMTAASGKNAIEITANGVGTNAKPCLDINADSEIPGGITATGKACIYYNNANKINDRLMVTINNGVFAGSYAVQSTSGPLNKFGFCTSPLRGQGAPYYVINGGTFNAQVYLNAAMLKVTGGTFNKGLTCMGDSTAYRLICGGTFKSFGSMTPESNEHDSKNPHMKFGITTSKDDFSTRAYNVGVYVDDDGYLVVDGDVITEPGNIFEAHTTEYNKWSYLLKYSSAKDNGLYYTDVNTLITKLNGKLNSGEKVTLDITDSEDTLDGKTIKLGSGDSKLTIIYNPTDDSGWTVQSEEGNVIEKPYSEESVNGVNKSIYINQYTVGFVTNADSHIDSQKIWYNEKVTELTNELTKKGHTFGDWYSDSESTTGYDFDKNFVTKSFTLYAKWNPNNYTVVFNGNGGEGVMSNQEFDYDDEQVLSKNTFTRTGYTFVGWNNKSDGTGTNYVDESSENLTDEDDKTVTLYAQWTPNTYYVSFNSNGGTGDMVSQQFTYDVSQSLTSNTFTRTGYTFAGWAESTGGEVKYADGAQVQNLTTVKDGTVTLYANWTANTYTLNFNPNGGSVTPSSKTVTYGSPYGELPIPTRDGYTFNGWTQNIGGGTVYTEESIVRSDNEHTFYAQWEEIPQESITPSGGGGEGGYLSFPRTTTDGGDIDFGKSKVIKAVVLPEGSSGSVVLKVDSIDHWPEELETEYTFDISVEKLGEGMSYIHFEIPENTFTELGLTAADVGVYHQRGDVWTELKTTYEIKDGIVCYESETDSFSPFKLVIEEGAAKQKEGTVTPSEPVEPVIPDEPQEELDPIKPIEPTEPESPTPLLAVLAGLGAAVVLRRK